MTRGEILSGLANGTKPAPIQRNSRLSLGQSYPQHCPTPKASENALSALGDPLSIRKVSEMIGCSAWTIRQRYIPEGLPHLRSGPAGKLIFFRNQVIAWILQQQHRTQKAQKGGR